MIERILQFSLKQRWLILLVVFGLVGLGIYNFTRLPIDAVPDITNVQVQINTEASGLTPYEVEQRITYPIEVAMSGLPKLDYTRSLSRYGLSQVTVVFKEGTNIYFARQLITERLQSIKSQLPNGLEPQLGPISTGLGEIFMYSVTAKSGALNSKGKPYTPTQLRTIQDWLIRPQLRNIPGVAEVNAIGGYEKQYQVTPDPKKMIQYGITLHDIEQALKNNNNNVGAGYIEKHGEQFLIRVPGQLKTVKAIGNVVVRSHRGVSLRISDLGTVVISHALRSGAGTTGGREAVIGTVSMLMGDNSRVVAKRIAKRLQAVNKTLPKGVVATPVYNRTSLVNATINTVKNNLMEGALLVCIILFLFLGNIRAALITAAVIPISMLMTITGMVHYKISANLMSMGALDFGLIVDGAVIIVENCIKQLGLQSKGNVLSLSERLSITLAASKEVIKPSIFGVLIITIVYIPILTLTGVEGKMFIPMAETVILALLSALVLSLTFVPAAIGILLRGKITEKPNLLVRAAESVYSPCLRANLKWPWASLVVALGIIVLAAILASQMGGEFVPSLDEGDIALHAMRTPSTSLSQSIKMQELVEKTALTFPEVSHVFSKIGTAEVATDPMPPNVADTFVMLKPRKEWPNPNMPKIQLINQLHAALKKLPGNNYEFTQPIQMRFNELISGVRSDVAVKLFGDDMNVLLNNANKIAAILKQIKGSADVKVEQVSGLPMITIHINRHLLARYGLSMSQVQNTVAAALGGSEVGKIYQGDQRFDLTVRLSETLRKDSQILHKIYIDLPGFNDGKRHFIPLSEIATLNINTGPNQISRENGKRRIVVTTNVRGRDLRSFVDSAQNQIDKKLSLPSGYWLAWGGQFEQLASATERLMIVVPIVLLLIFVLLFMSLGSVSDSIIVFTGVPLALTGGVFSLWLRGIPLSISAGVGFIALSGVAVLNGLVILTFISKLVRQEFPIKEAVFQGALQRLRPVLMTALVASLGFVPMAISTGTGAEVQRPLATVVIGGIISSTLLTLFVLPCLYYLVHGKQGKNVRIHKQG
ncbi:MAG: CusA/CzcA family heavy metal efflux RND transporter [Legionellales bacterium]|nr:CusA/CzcA family heavy metal efflux RND transporter [Legionellales bacterium]